ncbi:MAG: hypothetical protein WCH99_07325 [Verrucomicrobiota bacterium]
MKQQIVSDGVRRLQTGPGFQASLLELRQTIQARHAAEIAQAGFFRRLILRCQITIEYQRERRKLFPSPHTLYSSRISA